MSTRFTASCELNAPVISESVFHAESIGKTSSATSVIMLVEESKVALDDSITKYFPEAPQEAFSGTTADSFVQTTSEGTVGENLWPTRTANAAKLQGNLTRMSLPYPHIPVESSLGAQAEINKLIRAFGGSWFIQLSFAPSEQMPKGGSGNGEEIWRAGPGGNSLIEEYHSTGAGGEVSGLNDGVRLRKRQSEIRFKNQEKTKE
jgi:hypothetical protein